MVKFPAMKTHNVFTDKCPCGSDRLTIDCCYASMDTTPKGPPTGYSNPRCYARSLYDCSEKISREHYISEGILKIFETKGIRQVEFTADGGTKVLFTVGINSFQSKVLCNRHNSALSSLDTLAKKFFAFVLGQVEHQDVMIVRGYEIERWLLKVFCGLSFAGTLMNMDWTNTTESVEPNPEFLQVLFYNKPIPEGHGLVYVLGEGPDVKLGAIRWGPMIHESEGLIGFDFQLGYFRLLLAFGPMSDTEHIPSKQRGLRYHPAAIQIRRLDRVMEVYLGWPEGKFVVLDVHEV